MLRDWLGGKPIAIINVRNKSLFCQVRKDGCIELSKSQVGEAGLGTDRLKRKPLNFEAEFPGSSVRLVTLGDTTQPDYVAVEGHIRKLEAGVAGGGKQRRQQKRHRLAPPPAS